MFTCLNCSGYVEIAANNKSTQISMYMAVVLDTCIVGTPSYVATEVQLPATLTQHVIWIPNIKNL